jgi:glutamate/tyrosine decarboxylase-like PLP-dependent enzyme
MSETLDPDDWDEMRTLGHRVVDDVVCFRFNPGAADREELNKLNQELLIQLHEGGVVLPSYTTLKGRYCLRAAIVNHRSRLDDFDALVDEVLKIGSRLSDSP